MVKSQGSNAEWVGLVLLVATTTLCCLLGVAEAVQHQVGGTAGWTLPSIGNVNYTVWESTQTFNVGDTLYFNYSKDNHNVMEVTEANYESCTVSSPIATWDDGATVITLNRSGSFYYICGVTGHCAAGQKVSVQVVAAETVQHQVGGTAGWTLPSIGNVNYTVWESSQTFKVGDTLYFNYSKDSHNVMEVTEANYESCNASSPIATWDNGATVITLNRSGNFYYICGVTGHCAAGQKVSVPVLAANASGRVAPSPSSTPSPTTPTAASPPGSGEAALSPSSSVLTPPSTSSTPPSRKPALSACTLFATVAIALSASFI